MGMAKKYGELVYFSDYDECGIDYEAYVGCCEGIAILDEKKERVVFIPWTRIERIVFGPRSVEIATASRERWIIECDPELGRQTRVAVETYRGNA